MSEVATKETPDNWEVVPLKNVISLKKGKKPKDLGEKSKDRNIPYIDIKAFETGEIRKYSTDEKAVLCKEDDVLVVWDGSRSGLVGFGAKGAVGSTIAKVDPSGLYSKYLYYFLQSNFLYLNTNTRGVGIPHVDPGVFNNLEFPVAPFEQQKRIVAKIEELFSHIDAGIEALNKAKQLLKQYRQSVLKAAVTGELSKEWREANKVSYESWRETTIGDISLVQTGKTPKRSTEDFWKDGTIPWLTSSATNAPFTHNADQFVTQVAVDAGLKLFEQGTLLLAMYGEGKTRGQVTEITFQASCNQACAAIIVDEQKAMKEYVRLRLNENYEQTRKAASGGNQPNLNLSKVREISLPLPLLREQSEIVSRVEEKFESIKRLENDLEAQLFKAEKNKQSILAAVFSGDLHD